MTGQSSGPPIARMAPVHSHRPGPGASARDPLSVAKPDFDSHQQYRRGIRDQTQWTELFDHKNLQQNQA